jgi:hypothetical protein
VAKEQGAVRLENGSTAHGPSAFLLLSIDRVDSPGVLCDAAGCNQVHLPSGYAHLLVDTKRKEVVTIAKKTAASSEVFVQATN